MNIAKRFLVILLSMLLFLCSLSIAASESPHEESDDGIFYLGEHKYQVFDTYMTWSEAKQYCESLGGHLATITSAEEQSVLNNINGNYWLGGTDSGNEGVWRWITGEPWTYSKWFEGEPNNLEDAEHYLVTWDDHTWNDLCFDSSEQGGFVCEWDNIPTMQIPDDAITYKGHSYKIYFDSTIGWHDAKTFCEDLGGHLVTITNAEENAFVYSRIEGSEDSYWLGATDELCEGEWKWVTGEEWDYSNANFDNCGDLQHYLVIGLYGDVWDDQSEKGLPESEDLCKTVGFICEWDTVSETSAQSFGQLLGVYDGSYTATQGLTGLTLSIYRTQELLNDDLLLQKYADIANSCQTSEESITQNFTVESVREIIAQHTDDYVALFNFFPLVDKSNGETINPDVEEGLYTMTIEYHRESETYDFLQGYWIQHDTYVMADLKNIVLSGDTLSGDVYGEYADWFWTEYGDLGDVSVCRDSEQSGYRIDFETESISLNFDQSLNIKAFVKNNHGLMPEEAAVIQWFSADESIAQVTGENWGDSGFDYAVGNIIAVSEGETTIYAILSNGRTAACTVSVKSIPTIAGRVFEKNIDYYAYTTDCSSSEYNPTLSNMLAALSSAAYKEDKIIDAYRSLGFNVKNIVPNDYDGTDSNRCGSVIGIKKSSYNDDIICLVSLRGTTGDFPSSPEWQGNFKIFTTIEGKHYSFYRAMETVYGYIEEILQSSITTENVKYFITGHSRGGAVANLLAVELMENGVSPENIYNYNYAPPDVACKILFPIYRNIFNLCNRKDIVPLLPGSICSLFTSSGTSWGKYGQTYWFTEKGTSSKNPIVANHAHDTLYLEYFDQQLKLSDWPYSFDDFAWDVNYWNGKLRAKILCPVDVIITDETGNTVASVINGEIKYYNTDKEIIIFTDGDAKMIYFNNEEKFNVNLIGTDEGTMTYSLEKGNFATGEIIESKTFNNVTLTKGKTMFSTIDSSNNLKDTNLFIVTEEGGEKIPTHTINTDGKENAIICNHTWDASTITKEATHTAVGQKTYSCSKCKATKTEEIAKTTDHIFGEWVIAKEATETTAGTQEKSCICGHKVIEEIPKKVFSSESPTISQEQPILSGDANENESKDQQTASGGAIKEKGQQSSSDTASRENTNEQPKSDKSIHKKTLIIIGASIAGTALLLTFALLFIKKKKLNFKEN